MFINDVYKLPGKEIVAGGKARFIHSENMTLAFWEFEKGSILPQHSHPHEQVCHILEGSLDLTLEGKTYKMQAGSTLVIPSHAVHSAIAPVAVKVLDTFYPVREDYL